nr:hypothetical protein [Caulobacter vibrioides]
MLNFRQDALGHEIRIAERLTVADTHDAIPLGRKPGVARGVVQLSFRMIMPAAVDFDDEP